MRMLSVIGALALACLCFASPALATPPDYPVSADVIMFEPAPAFDMFAPVAHPAIDAITHDADLFLASTITADKADCHTVAKVDTSPAETTTTGAMITATCRRYDPGWLGN